MLSYLWIPCYYNSEAGTDDHTIPDPGPIRIINAESLEQAQEIAIKTCQSWGYERQDAIVKVGKWDHFERLDTIERVSS